MASPTGTPVGRPRPTGRGARMTRRPIPGSLLVHAERSPVEEASSAQEKPRRARRTLEREAPQDRDRRLARVRRDRVRPRRRDRDEARSPTRTPATAPRASPTRRSAAPTSPTSPTSRCSFRLAAAQGGHGRRPRVQGGRRRPSSAASKDAPHTVEVATPLAKGNEGQISKDRRSALVTFSIPGDDDQADERVDASLAATAAAQKAHPDLRIEQFGDASADKALGACARRRLQAGGVPLAPDHAADPDRRLRRARRRRRPAAAGHHRRDRHARPRRPDQPDRPDGGVGELRDPADRPRGRRRLLDVLPAAKDGGARRRAQQRGGARVRRRDVRQGRARLRPHRADRDGRHVPGRQRRLHVVRRRHDARRRRRDARQRHRPPRGAVQARRQRREGARAVHRRACAIATTASRACGPG